MKGVGYFLLVTILLTFGSDFARAGGHFTCAELIAARKHLNHKDVVVDGYFNVKMLDLRDEPDAAVEPVAIDLTKEQIRQLKLKGHFRSGYVRIAGRFDYVGPPKEKGTIGSGSERRILIYRPALFRSAYPYQITQIKKFEQIQRGEVGKKKK